MARASLVLNNVSCGCRQAPIHVGRLFCCFDLDSWIQDGAHQVAMNLWWGSLDAELSISAREVLSSGDRQIPLSKQLLTNLVR
ncbi:hypothetical protein BJX64DRAFT_111173 [Aspergillus heterothallicus]